MGHQRIGALPDTEPWHKVVSCIADGEGVAAVAAATMEAAQEGLAYARADRGLAHCVVLLDTIVRAARETDFAGVLRQQGFDVPDQPGIFDLAAAFTESVDAFRDRHRCGSDPGEMAELAAVEALALLLGRGSDSLFGSTPREVAGAARQLASRSGFGNLAHEFLGRFLRRFLTYHLSRELPLHVGGNGRFADPSEHNAFVERLGTMCTEVAAISEKFAGDWYAKAHSPAGHGVNDATARGFVAKALNKLSDELKLRGQRHGG
jgi:hypothetical protein